VLGLCTVFRLPRAASYSSVNFHPIPQSLTTSLQYILLCTIYQMFIAMDIKNLMKFSYSGLDSGTNMVRLVRLSRAEDSTIVGELKHFSLDSPACPKYTTLSYVWGENAIRML